MRLTNSLILLVLVFLPTVVGCGQSSNKAQPTTDVIPPRPTAGANAGEGGNKGAANIPATTSQAPAD